MGEAYAHMMDIMSSLLTRRGCDGVTPLLTKNPTESPLPLDALGRAFVLARDAETDRRWTIAAAEHKTRLSVAMLADGAGRDVTASAWFDYCGFVLRARGSASGRAAFGFDRSRPVSIAGTELGSL